MEHPEPDSHEGFRGGSSVTSLMARRTEPPDGGWGWMVVLSAFFQSALVFGVLRSFSVFFVEFVAAFDEPAARVSWIASIGIAVQQFGSECGAWGRCPKTEERGNAGTVREEGGGEVGERCWRRMPEVFSQNSFLFPRPRGQCPEHEVRAKASGDGWGHLGSAGDAAGLFCYLLDPLVPEYWATLR